MKLIRTDQVFLISKLEFEKKFGFNGTILSIAEENSMDFKVTIRKVEEK
jgi:hypothetical protein